MPISRVAQAKTGFHSVTSPFLRHFSATVFGRSRTPEEPLPQLSKCCARLRTRLSTVSSFTTHGNYPGNFRQRLIEGSDTVDIRAAGVSHANYSRHRLSTP